MRIKGKNKYGLKLEDFDSYEDYKIALRRLMQSKYNKSEKCKLNQSRYIKSEKGKLNQSRYTKSEKGKLVMSKYKKSEKGLLATRFNNSKRRASKLQRTVPWSNLEEIANFYKACPKGLEVDHIIPLQGKYVSGLHVLNNLQYLTKSQNSSKGNRYEHR